MGKKSLLMAMLLICAKADSEDFISEFEYGQMLYHDPRGVSCAPCHGDRGEGRIIAGYTTSEGGKRFLRGPAIRNVSLEILANTIRKGPGVMPRYFLTDEEIRAIYRYLNEAENRVEEAE